MYLTTTSATVVSMSNGFKVLCKKGYINPILSNDHLVLSAGNVSLPERHWETCRQRPLDLAQQRCSHTKKRKHVAVFFSPFLSAQTTILEDLCIPHQHVVTKMPEGGSRNIFSAESSHLAAELPEGINKYDSCRRPEPGTTLARESSRIHFVLCTRVPYVKCFSTWKCQIHSFQCTAVSLQRWQKKNKKKKQRRGTRTPS